MIRVKGRACVLNRSIGLRSLFATYCYSCLWVGVHSPDFVDVSENTSYSEDDGGE